MKKFNLIVLVLLLVFMLFNVALAVEESAGGENDPLVTQSYIEMRVEQIKAYYDGQISSLNTKIQNLQSQFESSHGDVASTTFEPVTVKCGQKILGGEGTEIILRVGSTVAITSAQGGIVDATSGIDIQNGKSVPLQHLLIIPRDDGRGLSVIGKNEAILMVKGAYIIQ